MSFADVGRKISDALDKIVDRELSSDWSTEANRLYKEQFAAKKNPYGEPWEYRKGDETRKQSRYFGKIVAVEPGSFSLRVAGPNAGRSCVPFEPRGLGSWRPTFKDVLWKRIASRLSGFHV